MIDPACAMMLGGNKAVRRLPPGRATKHLLQLILLVPPHRTRTSYLALRSLQQARKSEDVSARPDRRDGCFALAVVSRRDDSKSNEITAVSLEAWMLILILQLVVRHLFPLNVTHGLLLAFSWELEKARCLENSWLLRLIRCL